jgi:hypothetical protein
MLAIGSVPVAAVRTCMPSDSGDYLTQACGPNSLYSELRGDVFSGLAASGASVSTAPAAVGPGGDGEPEGRGCAASRPDLGYQRSGPDGRNISWKVLSDTLRRLEGSGYVGPPGSSGRKASPRQEEHDWLAPGRGRARASGHAVTSQARNHRHNLKNNARPI